MPRTEVKRRLPHSWDALYGLVMAVDEYPQFVPYCRAAKVLTRREQADGEEVLARMEVGFGPLHESYTSRVTGHRGEQRIAIRATDGPFRHLVGSWTFRPAGSAATDVTFEIDYEFRNPLLALTAGRVFKSIFGDFVRAFEKRANEKLAS